RQSASCVRSSIRATTTSSGTRAPALIAATKPAGGFPFPVAAGRLSPGEMGGTPNRPQTILACVPFPAPTGPTNTIRIDSVLLVLAHSDTRGTPAAPRQAFVIARNQVRLDLVDGVERNTDDNHDRGA